MMRLDHHDGAPKALFTALITALITALSTALILILLATSTVAAPDLLAQDVHPAQQADQPAKQEGEVPGHPGLAAKIDAEAQAFVSAGMSVGLVIGVLQGDQTWIRGYGEVTRGGGQTPTGSTIYEIGSVSKVFTGILLADAVERELITLEQPVSEILADYVDVPAFEGEPIRLWHLSTHTSALPRMPNNFKPKDPRNPYADYTRDLLFEFLEGYQLKRAPGQKYAYSNLGAGLLGQTIAILQESSYEQLLASRIIVPLGLDNTACKLTEEMRSRFAPGYNVDQEAQSTWDFLALAPAGGIRSDMTDMLRFARANLHPEETPIEAALRLAQVIKHSQSDGTQIALGWHAASGGATRWHNGQTGGYHTYLAIWPKGDCAVALFANTTSGHADRCADNILVQMMGGEPRPVTYRKSVQVARETLEPCVGEYAIGGGARMKVTLEEGGLFAKVTFQPKLRLHAAGGGVFFYRAVEAEVRFKKNADGEVDEMEIHQNGVIVKGERREPKLP